MDRISRSDDPAETPQPRRDDEATLLDMAAVLLRRWRTVALTTLVFTLLAAGYALSRPKVYTAEVVIVPSAPPAPDLRSQLVAQLPMAGLIRPGGGGSSNAAVVQAVLKSRTLRDSVARQVLETPPGREAGEAEVARVLNKQMRVEPEAGERSVKVLVLATDPQLAAEVAGRVPGAVNAIAGDLAVETAERRRETLERQLDGARARLTASEERLREFQERHGTPELREQAKQTLVAAGELQRGILEAEVRLAELRRTTTPDHPRYRAAAAEVAALRDQLRRLGRTDSGDPLLSRDELPGMQVDLARLLREYAKDEQVYLSLTGDLLSTQSDAAGDLAVVSVLDGAVVPEIPSGPRVKLLVALGVMLGLVAGLFLAFTRDYVQRARGSRRDDEFFAEWDRLRGSVTGALPLRRGNGTHSPVG
jgi:tyrosine-protein kinase Etk/Wzc